MLTKGAIGNLINRYKAVLKKCHLLNTFGSLAVASMLVMGAAGVAMGANSTTITPVSGASALVYDGNLYFAAGSEGLKDSITITDGKITANVDKQSPANHGILTNLRKENGGEVSSIIITDSSFTNTTNTSAVSLWDMGNVESTITKEIYNSIFSDNTTTYAGGAVSIFKNSDVNYSGNTNFENVYFKNNISTKMGGAIVAEAENLTFTGGSFEGNRTDGRGGAIFLTKGVHSNFSDRGTAESTLTINGTNFTNNTSKAEGGAIYAYMPSKINISNNSFTNNTGTVGGAVSLWADNLSNAEIKDSTGSNSVTYTFDNVKFSDNKAIREEKPGKGGAIAFMPYETLNNVTVNADLTNVEFTNNTSNGTGGAIQGESANIALSEAIFTGNKANEENGQGGAIYIAKGSDLSIDNGIFTDNEAGKYGGAIAGDLEGTATLTIQNSKFDGNKATTSNGSGGAIALWTNGSEDGAQHTITDTVFTGNTAERKGGAIASLVNHSGTTQTLNLDIDGVDFIENEAGLSGGALHLENAETSIADSTFSGNKAGTEGGAMYIAANSSSTFTGTNTFSDNTANGIGNDIHNAGTMTVASGVTRLDSGYSQEGTDSVLNVNTGATLAVAMPDMGGVTASDDEAMLALGDQITLGGGKLRVGEDFADPDADVAFGANSVLVVDGKVAAESPLINGDTQETLSVADGSKLYIANAQAGEAYTITDGLNAEGYWDSANLLTGRLIEAEVSQDGDSIVVETEAQDAAKVLPGIIPVAALDTMVTSNLNDTDSSSMGIRFLSRAMDDVQFMPSDATATAMVNEVSRAAVTAGVQNTALRLADAGADQLIHHLSLSFFGKENNIHKDGVDVWATPMYGNTYTHGMVASGTAVRGNYGGITLGADAKVGEILGGKVRVGAAVNGGGGKSETRGTATSTDNEYNFGGVNLYAGWNLDNFNVMASVGYAMANHDVKMNLPAAMGMGQAKADVDTNAFIADLRAEYQINTDVVDILPHAGVRYTALNTESHDLKVNGSTLNSVASDTQHIVQFPIGVTVSKDIDVSGWNVKPQADVSVIPAAGEKKNTTKVSYAGIGALDSVNTRIMDSTSWAGMVGVQAEKGNFALGLNYGVQASSHETDQSVSVGISWKF